MSRQLWVVRIRLQTAENRTNAVHTLLSILVSHLQNYLTHEILERNLM
jgi:hypothetical protein